MKKNKRYIGFAALLLGFGSTPGFSQGLNEHITVYGTPTRPLEKSNRPAENPAYKDTTIEIKALDYRNMPAQASSEVNPEPIGQAKLKINEKIDRLYRSYARLGFGNYSNLLAEYYFNQERARDNDYGIHLKHLSSAGGIDDVGYNGLSQDGIDMYGKKYWRDLYGKISGGYNRNSIHYYGFDADSLGFGKKDYAQIYQEPYIKFETGTFRGDTSRLRHQESLYYRPFFDHFGTVEHFINGTFSGGKFRNHEYYSLDAYIDANLYNNAKEAGFETFKTPANYIAITKNATGLFKLNPSVNTHFKSLLLRVGLTVAANVENSAAKFHFYPDIDLSYSLFNNIFIPYLRIGGNMQRNSYYTLSQVNPFVMNTVTPSNTNQKILLSGGFKGSLGSKTSFNLSAGYSVNDNMPLYINDTTFSYMNRFGIVQDEVSITQFSAQMLYRLEEKWHILLTGNYYLYETRDQLYAWHRPDFDAKLALVYNLGNKIIARANTRVVGNRKAWSLNPITGQNPEQGVYYVVNLKPYVDADLQLEYRYTSRFSVFLNLNNIASQKYQSWYKYRVQAFNLLGGLTYSF